MAPGNVEQYTKVIKELVDRREWILNHPDKIYSTRPKFADEFSICVQANTPEKSTLCLSGTTISLLGKFEKATSTYRGLIHNRIEAIDYVSSAIRYFADQIYESD